MVGEVAQSISASEVVEWMPYVVARKASLLLLLPVVTELKNMAWVREENRDERKTRNIRRSDTVLRRQIRQGARGERTAPFSHEFPYFLGGGGFCLRS